MNIVIVGAGALGTYFGARWIEAGANVSFFVREGRKAQIEKEGLEITSVKGNAKIENPHLLTKPDEVKDPDLVLLGVKGYHIEGTVPSLKEFVSKGAKVLPILNGIEHLSVLKEELGEEAVLGGLSYIIATLDDRGHVKHTSDFHELIFGPLHPSHQEVCKELNLISKHANFNCVLSSTIEEEMWKKYMFISAMSGVTTAGDFHTGTIRDVPETFELVQKVMKEIGMLASKYDVQINQEDIVRRMEQFNQLPYEATSSMHQDKRKKNKLEVEHLQGGALRLAERVQLTLPYTETLYRLIKPYETQE
ncbi:ketopantoate reductase family protein [Pseudalkalibacillus hwajinpoensis]|uniref:2-dehydropantoate 2-reductase n=1 Tax=Guptibacillus hwajinpoensis TaxID=208199 RepID=A0A4U1ML95_9BACL|nr:ketopantoate reductase family protein [Pseudalkalibacillus hwajinpoensis]TKD71302.1 ketopantoate reductase family protein [Pseudalkalibacillus hwajinpoensis]